MAQIHAHLQEAAWAGVWAGVGEWNWLGFLPLTPQPGALVQDMACPNPKAALGSFVHRFFGNWLELDEDHKKYSVPCCERSGNPSTTHASPLILLNPLELTVPLPSTYTSFRDFPSFPPTLTSSPLTTKTWTLCPQLETTPKQHQRDTLGSFQG